MLAIKVANNQKENTQVILASWKTFYTLPGKQMVSICSYHKTDLDLLRTIVGMCQQI